MRINLLPMAGEGSRFRNYIDTPKPFLPINNKSLYRLAFNSFPNGDRNVFIVLDKHWKMYAEKILDEINDIKGLVNITIQEGKKEGQVMTCMEAEKYISRNDRLFIGFCDNIIEYNKEDYEKFINKYSFDIIVFTFQPKNNYIQTPLDQLGYVKLDSEGNIINIFEKQLISENPIEDYATVGMFEFRKGEIFLDMVEIMKQKELKLNGEYYITVGINELIKKGYQVGMFVVNKFYSVNTPIDYEYVKNIFE